MSELIERTASASVDDESGITKKATKTRRTRRRGSPAAQPLGITAARRDSLQDADDRIELEVDACEPLATWTVMSPEMARKLQPDYRVEFTGIVFHDGEEVPDGRIYPPLRTPPIDGKRMLILRARVYWRDATVFGQVLRHRDWPENEMRKSIEGTEQARNRYEIEMAERGLDLLVGWAPRGRPADDREGELNRLAKLALKWLRIQRQRGRGIDDLTWPILAQLDLDRSVKKLQAKASKLSFRITDVRQRALELDGWLPP
jgi:hypothetical protein